MFKRYQSARTRSQPFAVPFAVIFLRPYLAQDRLTHCKDECSSAMKSAKSRRFGPPKKTLTAKGLALSENFGLRRLVLEDCVRHQFRGARLIGDGPTRPGSNLPFSPPGNSALRRPCLAERHHPPLFLIPKREPDAGEAFPECEPAADLFELGMVPQDLGKPVEGNAARQVMHVMHADIAGEPGKRRRQVVKGAAVQRCLGLAPVRGRLFCQIASFTSVLRPGTFFTCAALARISSNSPSARICQTGFQ